MKKVALYLLMLSFLIIATTVIIMKNTHCGLIPREIIFSNQGKKYSPTLSPNGEFLAYIAPVDNVFNIWVRDREKQNDHPITHDTNRGIRSFWWSYNNDMLFYMEDKNGDENWRLYSVALADEIVREYTPFDKVKVGILEYNKDFPDKMLITMNKRDSSSHDAYELTTTTGDLKLLAENDGSVSYWISNEALQILGKIEALPDGGFKLYVRNSHDDEWRELGVWGPDEIPPINEITNTHIYFSKDNRFLYLFDSRGNDTDRFVKIDVHTGEVVVLASDPHYDIEGGMLFDKESSKLLAIRYEKERLEWVFFDKETENLFEIFKTIDTGDIGIISRSCDGVLWTIVYTKDNGSPAYWLYNKKTDQKEFLFDYQPIFKHYTLSSQTPIYFISRDGFTIHGYLTYPACVEEKNNLPLILLVHGGPWARDYWGFSNEVQWLANRGYAVLQVNYRGSTGYGKKFLNAGNKQWGAAMQDDLIDGVRWAIQEKIADPKRIAIFGWSYGGYAALIGATFTPDIFVCAVDGCGPTNLITSISSFPKHMKALVRMFYNRAGNPETEKEFLESRSPLFFIENIKIPLFVAQGANDPRVKQEESEQIVAAMKQKGIPHEYLLFEDEGHGFVRPENKIKFYKHAEKFLADNLGGRYES